MKKSKFISYKSTVWSIRTEKFTRTALCINYYEAPNATGLIVWLPGMSDKPIADRNNPFLSYFIPRGLQKNFSVAVVCFPGTFDRRYIEERTLSTMRQNVSDAVVALSNVLNIILI